jgi:hypothetical protein
MSPRDTRRPLGRTVPRDWRHVERYPLTAATIPDPATPVVLGINWYEGFDRPAFDGVRYWIGRGTDWGRVRGGHGIAAKPPSVTDYAAWWAFYDQLSEGACVGFSVARVVTLIRRERYDARLLYKMAQRIDPWPGDAYDGTSLRAGLEVARTAGLAEVWGTSTKAVDPRNGIREYRWATTVEAVVRTLSGPPPPAGTRGQIERLGAVPLLNSWGREDYPHIVYLPLEALGRLLVEDGEAGTVVGDPPGAPGG